MEGSLDTEDEMSLKKKMMSSPIGNGNMMS